MRAALTTPIDSFLQDRTVTVNEINDQLWSTAAGSSWDFAVIPA
jgi:hypothetical protein